MTEDMDSQPLTLMLGSVGREIRMPAGGIVCRQGDAPQFFYVIQSGHLQVFRETAEGIRINLVELKAGEYFGEMSLVTGEPRTTSVEALEDSLLLEITKEEFDHVLDHNPQLARQILTPQKKIPDDLRELAVVHVVAASPLLRLISILSAVLGAILLIGGLYLALGGGSADTNIKLFGNEFSSTSVGVSVAFIGTMLVVVTFRSVLRSINQLASLPDTESTNKHSS